MRKGVSSMANEPTKIIFTVSKEINEPPSVFNEGLEKAKEGSKIVFTVLKTINKTPFVLNEGLKKAYGV
jgi:hypothetical protein